MSSNNSNDQLNALLSTAGKKLGISPDQLRAALSDPKTAETLLSQIESKSGGKIKTGDKSALEKMVKSNPQAKKLLDDLTRGGKNG
jgi:Uncharacterized protein conserved in bacteria